MTTEIEALTKYLGDWSKSVERMNRMFFTDKARYSEKFYAEVLSTAYGLSLFNLNALQGNFEAVDLGDADQRICFQITSTYTNTKIQNTKEMFFKKKLENNYDRLIIFFLCDEDDRSDKNETVSGVKIEILTLKSLFQYLNNLRPSKQRDLLNLLQSEFDENPTVRDIAFWSGRMRHQFPIEINVDEVENTGVINAMFNSRLIKQSFDNDFRSMMNGLIREIVQNVGKYGHPTSRKAKVTILPGQIVIEDWGDPFNPKKLGYMESDGKNHYGTYYYKMLKRRMRGRFRVKYKPGTAGVTPNTTYFNFIESLLTIRLYEDCCIWHKEASNTSLYEGCTTVFYMPELRHNGSQSRDDYQYFTSTLPTGQVSGIALFESDIDKEEDLRRSFPNIEIKVVKDIKLPGKKTLK